MPLAAMVIDLACSNSFSNHQEACQKFLEASGKTTQIYQNTDKTEAYITTTVKNETGEEIVYTITAAGFVYRSYRNKSVNIKLPTFGVCDSMSTKVGPDSGSLNLKWNVGW
jgi:hypothetical protein